MADDRFSTHVWTLLAGTTATLLSTFGLSFLGYGGTLAGLAVGSLFTGGATWWIERFYRRSASLAKAKAAAMKRVGRPLSVTETTTLKAVVDERDKRRWGIPWRTIAVTASLMAACSIAIVIVIGFAAGKPVSAIVQKKPAHGVFVPVGNESTPTPQPSQKSTESPTVSPSPSVSTVPPSQVVPTTGTSGTPTPSPSQSVTPTPTPSSSGSSPGVVVPSTSATPQASARSMVPG